MTDIENKQNDDLGHIKQDETKQVDYLAVCTFMYLTCDSVVSLREFSEALEKAREIMMDVEVDEITVTNKSRAIFAKLMVDNFLCRPTTEEK